MPVATLSLRGVRIRDRAAIALSVMVIAVVPLRAAAAKTPVPKLDSGGLWATVDVCNTAAHPDTIGIRGSMPGTGDEHETMYMAFIVEYRELDRQLALLRLGRAVALRGGRRRGRLDAPGRAGLQARPAVLRDPAAARASCCSSGGWARKVVTSTVRSTSAGHDPAAGADPAGFSAADCSIAPGGDQGEQPRIVGDHAGDAERREALDPRGVVDRPRVDLAAGARAPRRPAPP